LTCDCRLFCESKHKLLNCDAWTYDISTQVHSTWCVRIITHIVTIQINLARISQGASIKCHLDIKHRTLTGIDFNDTQLDTLSIFLLCENQSNIPWISNIEHWWVSILMIFHLLPWLLFLLCENGSLWNLSSSSPSWYRDPNGVNGSYPSKGIKVFSRSSVRSR
jgi:hypothetical protein